MSTQPEEIIEERLITEIRARRERGLNKYGTGVEKSPLTPWMWLQHAKEEALDLAIYLERLQDKLDQRDQQWIEWLQRHGSDRDSIEKFLERHPY